MSYRRRILVTGGAGFIGSALCRHLVRNAATTVVNRRQAHLCGQPRLARRRSRACHDYRFVRADICDGRRCASYARSASTMRSCISPPRAMSTARSTARRPSSRPTSSAPSACSAPRSTIGAALPSERRRRFRFHHVSTDEVFGVLPFDAGIFTEETPYAPSSPYSASKAASDHLVRAWHETYGLPVVLTNCSNNYGPYHFPEKLIPLVILNALEGKPLPVYGKGENVRDWLMSRIMPARSSRLLRGKVGESYNVGGRAERTNRAVVEAICAMLDERWPRAAGKRYRELITFVTRSPGHDRRYAIDPAKTERDLEWRATETFETGLAKTIDWYLVQRMVVATDSGRRYRAPRLGTG